MMVERENIHTWLLHLRHHPWLLLADGDFGVEVIGEKTEESSWERA